MRSFFFILLNFFFCSAVIGQQVNDSVSVQQDSVVAVVRVLPLQKILEENQFLQTKAKPVSRPIKLQQHSDNNNLFYLLMAVVFGFAVMIRVYKKYIPNLFRVFFNTSMKQSQLTDQLQQEELPSLFVNFIFVISAGVFAYLSLVHRPGVPAKLNYNQLFLFVGAVVAVYLGKYFVLKFTGWVTGFKAQANLYIFIVFLVNKLLGIFLLPVIIIVAFAQPAIARAFITTGLIVILLFVVARFVRFFNLLQPQIKVSKFHFLLYVFALEILPLVVLYKALGLVLVNFV